MYTLLSTIETKFRDNGFTTRRAGKEDLKRLLAILRHLGEKHGVSVATREIYRLSNAPGGHFTERFTAS